MGKQRGSVGLIAIVLASAVLRADSPLTSTDLASAYADLAVVKEARATKHVAGEVLRVLLGTDPNDRKAAVVNALGWQTPGNAAAFLDGLAAGRGIAVGDVKLAQLTASDRFVLGYLRAMETHEAPAALRAGALDVWGATPLQLLDQASQALPEDFTVHYVRALVEAQSVMSESWCSAYLATERVLEKFPQRKRNLRPAAVAAAQSYMNAYKSDCGSAPTKAPAANKPLRLTAEYDQIYALARLGDTIIAGAQAGIVVWRPDERRPVASRDERICSSVLTWHDAAWAGCYGRLVRWNGTAWKGYLQDPARSESAFESLLGPSGELLARNGKDVWRYDAGSDTFAPIALDLGADPYDVLFRRNGELWRIDFLKAIVAPTRTLALQSRDYPGSDPRALMEDVSGRLWVIDFKMGVFRLDDVSGRFERQEGLEDTASAVAIDPVRGRTWLLHYTAGPILRDKDGTRHPTDLTSLQFMRDLLLDERTGDVWIAGWTGLVRLREDKGHWTTETWRAEGR
ncbi:MAG: hypothetical protein A3G21_02625 [Acidobacteria bacterium RIFCSPLOWO2_12_FULL_66_21]|nr:MAG: hypothetical protein A3G21_02625 [Acidobacteria bacterium RIFCSPLOWO2_12_FULL_66_21]